MHPDAYQLVQLATGAWSVRSLGVAETFHPVIGPEAEAQALYVGQTNLRSRLEQFSPDQEFVVWDIGLGAAANILAVFRAGSHTPTRLRALSFDKTLQPARFALNHVESLRYLKGFESPLTRLIDSCSQLTAPSDVPSVRFTNGHQEILWSLIVDDFPSWLFRQTQFKPPHLILYDAFSPAKNPEMWTLSVFSRLRRALNDQRPCLLPTYSRSTLLRVTLLLAGFFVGRGEATGEKEETTIASNCLNEVNYPLDMTWLSRARRSTSAEPLHSNQYIQHPLSDESWQKLQQHPQFQSSCE